MKKLIFLVSVILLLVSCNFFDDEEQAVSLEDNRFNGKFTYLYEYVAPDGINERRERLEFNFNGTNKVDYYHGVRAYQTNPVTSGRWEIWSNDRTVKFEVNKGMYRISYWIGGGGITDWQPYSFSDDGYTLVLQNYNFYINSTRNYSLTSSNKPPPPPPTYTVTFNSRGGTPIENIEGLSYGSLIPRPDDPEREGYIFNGWSTSLESIHDWDFTNNTIVNNTILYARWTYNASYNIGDIGPSGGIIFYCSENGFTMRDTGETCHYLEAALEDISSKVAWGSYTTAGHNYSFKFIYSGTGANIGTGRDNTNNILIYDSNAPAAKACKDYSSSEETDWFLPSRDELEQLYINRNIIGNMEPDWYWSSSEGYRSDVAWMQHFDDGRQNEYYSKASMIYVRAIRAF